MRAAGNHTVIEACACPLCDRPNDCQLCNTAAYKGQCWCASVEIPAELLARIPTELRNKACICRNCVMEFHRNTSFNTRQKLQPGDFYFDAGLMVFTEAYHLRRGWCCDSGCRHCPYRNLQTRPCEMDRMTIKPA